MNSPDKHAAIRFQETIPSRMDKAEQLCLRVRKALSKNHLSRFCFPVELLTREAVSNALTHGNRNDATKSIALELRMGRTWIRLQVSDEGEGFAWRRAVRNPGDADAITGRGLHLYALYAERLQFNSCGNQVTFWIHKDRKA